MARAISCYALGIYAILATIKVGPQWVEGGRRFDFAYLCLKLLIENVKLLAPTYSFLPIWVFKTVGLSGLSGSSSRRLPCHFVYYKDRIGVIYDTELYDALCNIT